MAGGTKRRRPRVAERHVLGTANGEGLVRFVKKAAVAAVRETRKATEERRRREYLESCREAAELSAQGYSYREIAQRQGVSSTSAVHGRIRRWREELANLRDVEVVRQGHAQRVEHLYGLLMSEYAEIVTAGSPPAVRVPLVVQIFDRMIRLATVHARIDGVYQEGPFAQVGQVNVGSGAGAGSQVNVRVPQNPEERDRLVEHLRAVDAIIMPAEAEEVAS